jgi:Flp pilus assembly protein TadD
MGQHRQASATLRRALRLDPKDVEVLHALGFLLVDEELEISQGVKLLETARRKAPRSAQLLADLAAGYLKLREVAKAQSVLRLMKRLRPMSKQTRTQLRRLQRLAVERMGSE